MEQTNVASSRLATRATKLAHAFAEDEKGTLPLEGAPAHHAQNELSLDHLFRTNTPAKGADETSSFTFDRFFSEEIAEPLSSGAAEPAPNTGTSGDDIAQFNAWLNGLKKT